jgi:hypothetical protein
MNEGGASGKNPPLKIIYEGEDPKMTATDNH